jgi:hypothetical protein
MALSKIGTGASDDQAGGSQTSRTVAFDAGIAAGDLVLLAVPYYEDTSNAVLTAPTGATFTDHGPAILFEGSGATESRLHIYSLVAAGTETGNVVVARTNQFFGTAMMCTLRGASALSVVSVTAGSPSGGAVTQIDAPSVTVGATQGIVAIYGISDPAGTYTGPAGMTLGISEPTEQSTTGRIYFESPAAGASGVRTLQWTNSRNAIGVMLLIEGANAGGGGGATLRKGSLMRLGVGR